MLVTTVSTHKSVSNKNKSLLAKLNKALQVYKLRRFDKLTNFNFG